LKSARQAPPGGAIVERQLEKKVKKDQGAGLGLRLARAHDGSNGVGLQDVSFSRGNVPCRNWQGQAYGGEVGSIEDVSGGLVSCEENVKADTIVTEKRHRITSRRVGTKCKSAISIKLMGTLKRAALVETIADRKVLGQNSGGQDATIPGRTWRYTVCT
jgi:hypothetical protein